MRLSITGKLQTEKVQRAVDRACRTGLSEAAGMLLGESNARVPVRTGTLRASGEARSEGSLQRALRLPGA